MKATGIVRRIDDLGRVVIPKEIRRTLRIREGDPLEIFTDRDGEVILKKYSPIGELTEFATEYVESLNDALGQVAIIADRDNIIAVAGASKKEFLEKRVSRSFEKAMEGKKALIITEKEKVCPLTADGSDEEKYISQVIVPIVSQGDSIGAVALLSKEEDKPLGELELKVAETAASFLGKQMEQ
ncbi:stage V sporulation protein T [Crassaminicella indica]|uniref:Stage V sporulation protein T n=1 Tax=Crassaminicella indica TaxID=2855394 RepID=A0ABX8REM3_9CLOT|nr:stage V sporulation protein T [Crassaminicella indica]QXM07226.1 stage V sporulation protein T [Crassaminicella indica]